MMALVFEGNGKILRDFCVKSYPRDSAYIVYNDKKAFIFSKYSNIIDHLKETFDLLPCEDYELSEGMTHFGSSLHALD